MERLNTLTAFYLLSAGRSVDEGLDRKSLLSLSSSSSPRHPVLELISAEAWLTSQGFRSNVIGRAIISRLDIVARLIEFLTNRLGRSCITAIASSSLLALSTEDWKNSTNFSGARKIHTNQNNKLRSRRERAEWQRQSEPSLQINFISSQAI